MAVPRAGQDRILPHDKLDPDSNPLKSVNLTFCRFHEVLPLATKTGRNQCLSILSCCPVPESLIEQSIRHIAGYLPFRILGIRGKPEVIHLDLKPATRTMPEKSGLRQVHVLDGNPPGDEGSLNLLQELGYPFHDGISDSVMRPEIVIRFYTNSSPKHQFFFTQAALDEPLRYFSRRAMSSAGTGTCWVELASCSKMFCSRLRSWVRRRECAIPRTSRAACGVTKGLPSRSPTIHEPKRMSNGRPQIFVTEPVAFLAGYSATERSFFQFTSRGL